MLQARPLRFASYLLINVCTVKMRQVRLFIRLKRDPRVRLTFPPVRPAARSGTAFCRGRRGPIGAEGILKKRGVKQTQVAATVGSGFPTRAVQGPPAEQPR